MATVADGAEVLNEDEEVFISAVFCLEDSKLMDEEWDGESEVVDVRDETSDEFESNEELDDLVQLMDEFSQSFSQQNTSDKVEVTEVAQGKVVSEENPPGTPDLSQMDDDLDACAARVADAMEKNGSLTKEEPIQIFEINPSFESTVELDGWSGQIPGNIKIVEETRKNSRTYKQRILTMRPFPEKDDLPQISPLRFLDIMRRKNMTYLGRIPKDYDLVHHGNARVVVIAKKKIDICINHSHVNLAEHEKGKLYVLPIGEIIIADVSGWCILSCFAESVESVYNKVEVGDELLIQASLCKSLEVPLDSKHPKLLEDPNFFQFRVPRGVTQLFNRANFLPMENKTNAQCSWRIGHRPRRTLHEIVPQGNGLFPDDYRLLTPSKLRAIFKKPAAHKELIAGRGYFDLVGLVTYVGRMQRSRVLTQDGLPIRVIRKTECEEADFERFTIVRWLQIGDPHPHQVDLKLYVNSSTVGCQPDIVPGQMVILTHCRIGHQAPYSTPFCATSYWSDIFYGDRLDIYFKLRPKKVYEDVKSIANDKMTFYRLALIRNKNYFAGGTLSSTIQTSVKLKAHYLIAANGKQSRAERHATIGPKDFLPREVDPEVFYYGHIVAARQVTEKWETIQKKLSYQKVQLSDYNLFSGGYGKDFVLDEFYRWNYFRFQLPVNFKELVDRSKKQTFEALMRDVTSLSRPFCNVLLLPSKLPSLVDPPKISGLEREEKSPFTLLLVDCGEGRGIQEMMWINEKYSAEEKWDMISTLEWERKICGIGERVKTTAETPIINIIHDLRQDPDKN